MVAAVVLSGCGGGGGSSSAPAASLTDSGDGEGASWAPGAFRPATQFAQRCAAPRSGNFPDVQGSRLDENNWLRSWSHELYLWYDEIVDRDPALYETPRYFELQKTTAETSSGRPRDRFHYSMATERWETLSQSGVSAGYGAHWAVLAASPPREIRVAYTEPGSPATSPGIELARGARVLEIDGVDVVNDATQAGVDLINRALFPDNAGESFVFTIRDVAGDAPRTVTLTAVDQAVTPVQRVGRIPVADGEVGYFLFNEHIAPAEQALIDAVSELDAAGIADLVVDVRYNGGGFLDIASELAFMIAGSQRTAGRVFERLSFNDKHPAVNPVTGRAITPLPFHDAAQGFSATAGQPLPSLDLARVFVLTGPGTCSATESVINALRGVDVEVIQVGETSCGKPYGFYPTDNCGTTYFSIQFRGENNAGFGDYPDGFSPPGAGLAGVELPGCAVADDFQHPLGDAREARLAAALEYRATGSCPAGAATAAEAADGIRRDDGDGPAVQVPAVAPGKIMTRP